MYSAEWAFFGMKLVVDALPEEMLTPATELVEQQGIGVGAEELQRLHAELFLRDKNMTAGGVQPDTAMERSNAASSG